MTVSAQGFTKMIYFFRADRNSLHQLSFNDDGGKNVDLHCAN